MAYTPSSPVPQARQMGMTARPVFSQYTQPDNTETEQLAQSKVHSLLNSGGSLSPDVVAKLKARSKQQALSMADQAKANAQQALAGRGWNGMGGMRQGANAQIDMGAINNILGMNRDTDIQAATTNRADQLNALSAAEQFMQGRQARSSQGFRDTLAGQAAQTDSDFRLGEFLEGGRRFDADFGLKSWAAQEGAAQAAADSAFREDAFKKQFGLDTARFAEGQRQFDGSMGFNYANLNQQGNQSMLEFLMNSLG